MKADKAKEFNMSTEDIEAFSNALAELYLAGVISDKEYNESARLFRALYQV